MIRRTVLGSVADEEVRDASHSYSEKSPERALEFLSEVRVVIRSLQEFPFAKAVQLTSDGMEIRRAKVARFPYVLWYFVYPSFDTSTNEPLDVIYILGCRHERQGQPDWSSHDPFH